MVRMIVLPLGADWPPLTLWLWTRSRTAPSSPVSFLTVKPRSVSVFSASSDERGDDVGHLHHDRSLGHDDLDGVAPVQRAALG